MEPLAILQDIDKTGMVVTHQVYVPVGPELEAVSHSRLHGLKGDARQTRKAYYYGSQYLL